LLHFLKIPTFYVAVGFELDFFVTSTTGHATLYKQLGLTLEMDPESHGGGKRRQNPKNHPRRGIAAVRF
jgi:hypothetical protein